MTALPRSRPEAVGLASSALDALVLDARENGIALHSLMVLRRGHVAAELWWAPYSPERPHLLYSLSKSLASAGIGLAIAEGLTRLDERVVDIFPNGLPTEASPHLSAMTVRHLLTMTTGATTDRMPEIVASDDWTRAFLARPVERVPGTHWIYDSAASYMLSAIVQRRSGVRLLDYLAPRLLAPLGIEGARWAASPTGVDVGGWGMSLHTEDIAKFGLTLLRGGDGLLPAEYVAAATRRQASNGEGPPNDWNQGYGYQFWVGTHGSYRGDGAFAQLCVVIPDLDLVVVTTAGNGDIGAVLNLMWDHLLPACTEPEGEPGGEPYRREGLEIARPAGGRAATETATFVPGYETELGALRLTPEGDATRAEFADGPSLLVHPDRWQEGGDAFGFGPCLARGGWTSPETFEATLCLVDTPFHPRLTAREGTYTLEGPLGLPHLDRLSSR